MFQSLEIEPLTEAFEARCHTQVGGYRWFSWIVIPILSQALTHSIARDITHYKEIENQTVQALEQQKE